MHQTHYLLALITFTIAGCATVEDAPGDDTVARTDDRCTAEKSEFADYDDVSSCSDANPLLVETAIGAIVKSGGTCTMDDKDGTCSSIEPIKDVDTQTIARFPIHCKFEHPEGPGYYPYIVCCVHQHIPNSAGGEACWSACRNGQCL